MRFAELRHGGDRPFVLDLHPQLTLLTGLGDEGRRWMATLFERAVRGELDDVAGTVDVHGVERQLTDGLIAELALPADIDVVVRAVDLPGAEAVAVAPVTMRIDLVETPSDDVQPDLPDLRTIANELAQARHALARATENRAHTERLLDGSRAALAPGATDVAAAEARLEDARRCRHDAATRLEALVRAEPSDERRQAAARRAELHERRTTLEARRQRIMEALDAAGRGDHDPTDVAAVLAARTQSRPRLEPQPVVEALELADDLAAVHAQLAALGPQPPQPPPALLADAEQELHEAQAEVAAAESALAERRVSAHDAARIDAAHAAVLAAEDKADRRLAPPGARKRLEGLRDAERAVLTPLGFSSYSDYLLSTATLVVDRAAPMRLADARHRLADAEAVWDELTGHTRRAERERIEERQVSLLRRARDLLGELPDDGDVVGALRDLRTSVDEPDDDARLLTTLRNSGIDLDVDTHMDLVARAEQFLADADEAHARRAALQAELSSVADDLADVTRELSALPATHDDGETALDVARRELQHAHEVEQQAQRDAVAARSAADEHRAAIQRIDALETDVAGARAAEHQAGARVAHLEAATAAAEAEHERHRKARLAAADRKDAVLDLTSVERGPTEVYLLARVAAQRDVGQAGSLPLVVVLGDDHNGLPVETTQGVLEIVERCAPVVQAVLLSDDPAIEAWVSSFGEKAAVRRFSFVAASQ